MIRRLILSFTVSFALVSVCQAQHFLPADCTNLVNLLPPPPAMDSPAGRADLEIVLDVQHDRTPEQEARAKRVAKQSVTSFAQPVLGDWFRASDFPRTMALFKEIDHESQHIVDDQVKKQWSRARPYNYSPAVHPIVGRPDNTSYPSGHAAAAALWGTILSAAFPEKADQFQNQIHETMWCRVIGGVHFPSDTAAGEMLGEAIAKKMLESPDMQQALKAMREEIAPHLAAKPPVAASL
ncbi:MAG TPA: phosphatase PAP2 family protein [Verrucomicrobiae bacterium]|jgi:acid phosphatase (class A)|nr:phosphatase PAP2 family protein [Verrucomicrobiae bacterium]